MKASPKFLYNGAYPQRISKFVSPLIIVYMAWLCTTLVLCVTRHVLSLDELVIDPPDMGFVYRTKVKRFRDQMLALLV